MPNMDDLRSVIDWADQAENASDGEKAKVLNEILTRSAKQEAEAAVYEGLSDKMGNVAHYAASCAHAAYDIEDDDDPDGVKADEIFKVLNTADQMKRRYSRTAHSLHVQSQEMLRAANRLAQKTPGGEETIRQHPGYELPGQSAGYGTTDLLDPLPNEYPGGERPARKWEELSGAEVLQAKAIESDAMLGELERLRSYVGYATRDLQLIGLDDPTANKEYKALFRLHNRIQKEAQRCETSYFHYDNARQTYEHDNRRSLKKTGFGLDGYDENGFDRDGIHRNGTYYDEAGYDWEGFDQDGFDKDGFDEEGFDQGGFDLNGRSRDDQGQSYQPMPETAIGGSDISLWRGLQKTVSSVVRATKSSWDNRPKDGDIDVSAYDYMRNGKRVHVKGHKRKRAPRPRR